MRLFIGISRRLVAEISEIRSGSWDVKIRAKLSGGEPEPTLTTVSPEEQPSAAQSLQVYWSRFIKCVHLITIYTGTFGANGRYWSRRAGAKHR